MLHHRVCAHVRMLVSVPTRASSLRLRVLVQCTTRLPYLAPSLLLSCVCKTRLSPTASSFRSLSPSTCRARASTRRSSVFPFLLLGSDSSRCSLRATLRRWRPNFGGCASALHMCYSSRRPQLHVCVSGHAFHSDNLRLNDVGMETFCRAIKSHVEARFLFLSAVSTEPFFCLLSLRLFFVVFSGGAGCVSKLQGELGV